jgi:hypothetical protein
MSVLEEVTQEIQLHERTINTARYELEQAQQAGNNAATKQAAKRLKKLEAERMKLFKKAKQARKRQN